MSFLSIIKGIGHAIEKAVGAAATTVEPVIQLATPFVTILNPAAGAILNKIGSLVASVESMVTTANQGALKKTTVAQIAAQELPQLQAVIAEFGANVKIPTAELSAAIDASVANYNALAALVAAIQAQNAKPVTAASVDQSTTPILD